MVKQIFKYQMQKTKSTKTDKEKPQPKKKKYLPKHPDNTQKQLNALTHKIQSITLSDQSQTQVSPLTPRTKTIAKRKSPRKTPPKSPRKSLKKQTKYIQDESHQPQYKKFLTTLCPLHSAIYHKKTLKEQPITLEWYIKLKLIWKGNKEAKTQDQKIDSKLSKETFIKKTQKIIVVQKITVDLMKRLKPKHWLNDEVINSYIELIEMDLLTKNLQIKKSDYSVCLLKTYFAALKMTPQKIVGEIKKRALTEKSLLIIPINENYHWFFLIIFDQKMFVFDSILAKPLKSDKELNQCKKQYLLKDPVKKCIKLYEKVFKVEELNEKKMVIVSQFPQQDNQNDCGMMMLCGIKNVITKFQAVKRQEDIKKFGQSIQAKDFWTFCIKDIHYLRFMFGKELLQECLIL